LPVWLISTFLLLHCEEFAYERNLSGKDDRRFFGDSSGYHRVGASGSSSASSALTSGGGDRMDFYSLFRNASLSPR
jgi:TBCC domain-containing protein 1